MTYYSELVKALRCCTQNPPETCVGCTYNIGNNECAVRRMMTDAADAIEALQAQLPKRGEWELIDGAEPMRWGCARCKYLSWETSSYCPRCGAKMMEVQDGQK